MKLNQLINLLEKSGVNSKGQVLELLKSRNAWELEELAQSIQERVNEIIKTWEPEKENIWRKIETK